MFKLKWNFVIFIHFSLQYIDKDTEERNRPLMNEYIYTAKLIIDDGLLPDLFSLKEEWLAEVKGTGLSKSLSVYFSNIDIFLTQINTSGELLNRLEREYKEGKAYRYFKCEWVKDIYHHEISKNSKYCFLKTSHTMYVFRKR